jgi:hypothetical protein
MKNYRVMNRLALLIPLIVSSAFVSAQTNTFPASGNAGIGTTSPNEQLEIANSSSGGRLILSNGGGSNRKVFLMEGPVAAANFSQIESYDYGAAMGLPLLLNYNGGYIGIGTANPTLGQLQISGNPNSSSGPNRPRLGLEDLAGSGKWLIQPWSTAGDGNLAVLRSGGSGNILIAPDGNGNVGVGTTSPRTALDINGQLSLTQSAYGIRFYNGVANNWAYIKSASPTTGAALTIGDATGDVLTLNGSGNVGIGTATPSHKLAVNGTVRAKEVIVDTGWSDYVFEDSYKLKALSETEAYIKAERHLPGIPSAKEVAEHGVSMGDMQSKLLAKVEELTLHLIAQEKQLRALKQQNEELLSRFKP